MSIGGRGQLENCLTKQIKRKISLIYGILRPQPSMRVITTWGTLLPSGGPGLATFLMPMLPARACLQLTTAGAHARRRLGGVRDTLGAVGLLIICARNARIITG